ncbi:unnamed protein product [Pedinophyceae sp. YPF-701]|nr:unnamed protein product [Pedinophyceae sp. YPF-701]
MDRSLLGKSSLMRRSAAPGADTQQTGHAVRKAPVPVLPRPGDRPKTGGRPRWGVDDDEGSPSAHAESAAGRLDAREGAPGPASSDHDSGMLSRAWLAASAASSRQLDPLRTDVPLDPAAGSPRMPHISEAPLSPASSEPDLETMQSSASVLVREGAQGQLLDSPRPSEPRRGGLRRPRAATEMVPTSNAAERDLPGPRTLKFGVDEVREYEREGRDDASDSSGGSYASSMKSGATGYAPTEYVRQFQTALEISVEAAKAGDWEMVDQILYDMGLSETRDVIRKVITSTDNKQLVRKFAKQLAHDKAKLERKREIRQRALSLSSRNNAEWGGEPQEEAPRGRMGGYLAGAQRFAEFEREFERAKSSAGGLEDGDDADVAFATAAVRAGYKRATYAKSLGRHSGFGDAASVASSGRGRAEERFHLITSHENHAEESEVKWAATRAAVKEMERFEKSIKIMQEKSKKRIETRSHSLAHYFQKDEAAVVIQRYWRGFWTRKTLLKRLRREAMMTQLREFEDAMLDEIRREDAIRARAEREAKRRAVALELAEREKVAKERFLMRMMRSQGKTLSQGPRSETEEGTPSVAPQDSVPIAGLTDGLQIGTGAAVRRSEPGGAGGRKRLSVNPFLEQAAARQDSQFGLPGFVPPRGSRDSRPRQSSVLVGSQRAKSGVTRAPRTQLPAGIQEEDELRRVAAYSDGGELRKGPRQDGEHTRSTRSQSEAGQASARSRSATPPGTLRGPMLFIASDDEQPDDRKLPSDREKPRTGPVMKTPRVKTESGSYIASPGASAIRESASEHFGVSAPRVQRNPSPSSLARAEGKRSKKLAAAGRRGRPDAPEFSDDFSSGQLAQNAPGGPVAKRLASQAAHTVGRGGKWHFGPGRPGSGTAEDALPRRTLLSPPTGIGGILDAAAIQNKRTKQSRDKVRTRIAASEASAQASLDKLPFLVAGVGGKRPNQAAVSVPTALPGVRGAGQAGTPGHFATLAAESHDEEDAEARAAARPLQPDATGITEQPSSPRQRATAATVVQESSDRAPIWKSSSKRSFRQNAPLAPSVSQVPSPAPSKHERPLATQPSLEGATAPRMVRGSSPTRSPGGQQYPGKDAPAAAAARRRTRRRPPQLWVDLDEFTRHPTAQLRDGFPGRIVDTSAVSLLRCSMPKKGDAAVHLPLMAQLVVDTPIRPVRTRPPTRKLEPVGAQDAEHTAAVVSPVASPRGPGHDEREQARVLAGPGRTGAPAWGRGALRNDLVHAPAAITAAFEGALLRDVSSGSIGFAQAPPDVERLATSVKGRSKFATFLRQTPQVAFAPEELAALVPRNGDAARGFASTIA